LRERFLKAGGAALADYELLELLLFRAIPRRDVKPLAKALIAQFGSFAGVVSARPERLREVENLGEAAIVELKIVAEAAKRFAKVTIQNRSAMSSFSAVLDYCRTAMAYLDREEFRVLFLDKKNILIADEVQNTGTIDHAPVYPREIMRRAFELNATAIILVHNHPSGDPAPSPADIQMTQQIVAVGKSLNVAVHDHLIIGRDGFASFRGLQLI
jgi:DNA repair protein RadC